MYKWINKTFNTPTDRIAERRARMLIQGISSGAITLLAVLFAYWEFGTKIFTNNIFWLLLLGWAYLGLSLFFVRWEDASKKSEDEILVDKLDKLTNKLKENFENIEQALSKNTNAINELVEEIKRDREERIKGGHEHASSNDKRNPRL